MNTPKNDINYFAHEMDAMKYHNNENRFNLINEQLKTMGNGISINAKSYGLIGDRITDNTKKFQES